MQEEKSQLNKVDNVKGEALTVDVPATEALATAQHSWQSLDQERIFSCVSGRVKLRKRGSDYQRKNLRLNRAATRACSSWRFIYFTVAFALSWRSWNLYSTVNIPSSGPAQLKPLLNCKAFKADKCSSWLNWAVSECFIHKGINYPINSGIYEFRYMNSWKFNSWMN